MTLLLAIVIFVILIFLELFYFKIAEHYNIIDKPNHRSSHTKITIRGGGIIFSLAILLSPFIFGFHYPLFLAGLFLVAFISFIDDIKPVSNLVRIGFHLSAAILLTLQLDLIQFPWYYIFLSIVLVIGTINAVNFMDGINGITGIYSLVALCTLYYLDIGSQFTNRNYLEVSILSVVVFNYFNCRRKAVCFAGDVGSVAIAFIVTFFVLQLIIRTNNINYVILLLIYGLDTATTILFRLIRKENITQAHRSHFYQYLANEKKYPHLFVATVYGLSQLLVNIAIIRNADIGLSIFMLMLIFSTVLFLALRFLIEGKKRLLAN